MSSSKKIQFSSKLDIDSEHLHEKIIDNSTGEVKEISKEQPHSSTSRTTITSNPVKYEAKGTSEPHVTEGEAVDIVPALDGFNTSQL